MAEMKTLRDSLVDEIRDLFNAEKQLTKALPKLAKNATNPDLRAALESHLAETQEQVARLEQVFELLDESVRGKHCAGMAGIIEEGSDMLGEDAPDSVKDACIIAAGQRAEHYEMAAYGTCIAWARALDLEEVATLLETTLNEEKAADEKLSALAEAGINDAATAGEDEADDANEDDQDDAGSGELVGALARSAAAKPSASRAAKSPGRKRTN